MKTVSLEVGDLLSILDFTAVEKRLVSFPGVHHVAINAGSSAASITYDEQFTGPEQLVDQVRACGFHCRGEVAPRHVCVPTHLARAAVFALLLTAATGTYMSATYFELVPSSDQAFSFAPTGDGTMPAPIVSLTGLASISLTDLRELLFPAADDASDVFTVTTGTGQGYVDQASGAMLSFTPNSAWQQAYEFIYMLHTGQGAWMLALLVGVGALAAPALAITGSAIWWLRRRSMPRVAHNVAPRDADTVIVVGSESGATWGFAANLHEALSAHGLRVHLSAMNDLRRSYPKASRLFILTATYGDGVAPASAQQFLSRLKSFTSCPHFAVLGFGDQSFAQFCAYASEIEAALTTRGLDPLRPVYGIDRQSSADFAAWGTILSERLGIELQLSHVPPRPRTKRFVLDQRALYGVEVQAPVALLRFTMPNGSSWLPNWLGRPNLPHFEAGDLVGIVAPGSDVPRYYSLASSSRDGVLEICVRKQAGGLCSEYLHGLAPGDAVEAFIRPNPDFRPNRTRRPLILIGWPTAGWLPSPRRSRGSWAAVTCRIGCSTKAPPSRNW